MLCLKYQTLPLELNTATFFTAKQFIFSEVLWKILDLISAFNQMERVVRLELKNTQKSKMNKKCRDRKKLSSC